MEIEAQGAAPLAAAGLNRLGWDAETAEVREVVAAAARGTNIVTRLPPSPAWAAPVMAGLLGALQPGSGRLLLLCAPSLVAEWGALASALVTGTSLRVEAARGPSRAARRIKADAIDLLIASPDVATTLLTRSALAADRFTTIIFAWPEDWDADEAVTVLLQDLPKDAQRVVLTSRADAADALIERYARRALRFGAPVAGGPADHDATQSAPGFGAPVRTLAASWSGRAAAVAELLEATDPATATIWTADSRDHALILAALGGASEGVALAIRNPSQQGAVICYDLPPVELFTQLMANGDVTLIVPPGTESFVARVAPRRRPVQVATTSASLLTRDAALRAAIVAELTAATPDAALYALAPLFDRHEPQLVAAALFHLWRSAAAQAGAAAHPDVSTPVGGVSTAKLWVGVGKKDEATVGDLVAVLVKEVGVDRTLVGRIELRETFALVEVPAADADKIASGLTGLTIRRRKIVARVDRGPGAGRPDRGGSGGESGGGRVARAPRRS